MEFSPFNPIVKLCLQGMEMEQQGELEKAKDFFTQAWNEAAADFEKFLAAHYLARLTQQDPEKLNWLKQALHYALNVADVAVKSALPSLYLNLSKCHQALKNEVKAQHFAALASQHQNKPSDQGPFYHGTKADLKVGDLLTPGGNSNYQQSLKMNHIYFTAMANGAGLAAALAKGDGVERVYVVEPTGDFENDPNLTNQKFPGNPTRSYRSAAPLRIVGEVADWERQAPEVIQKFRERVENNQGEIIN